MRNLKDAADPTPRALTALGFDPRAVLVKEPGVLLDPKFLSALHAELEREFGSDEATTTLVQIGFLHGLQDATRAVQGAFAAERGAALLPSAPPLALRFQIQPGALPPAGFEVHGSWPERSEASALSAAGGHRACSLSAGYTSGWLSGILDADILALETGCVSRGDEACQFVAREAEAWRDADDAEALALLDALPFDAFRDVVHAERPEAAPAAGAFDPDAAVVHVWGAVMVIPFAGAEEALRTLHTMERDTASREVSVVVIDLSGAIIDEAFGAVALEQIVETVEAWGAEAIFADVSPISERVVAGLERQPLLIHKDQRQAIAVAFQIAEARRRPV